MLHDSQTDESHDLPSDLNLAESPYSGHFFGHNYIYVYI